MLRLIAIASAAALGLAACEPSVPQTASPASVVTAVFDPLNGAIPLPNDLVLQDPASLGQAPAQTELLLAFKAAGGFPNDQEVAVTIDFTRSALNSDGTSTNQPVTIDTATLTPETLAVFFISGGVPGAVALEPITAANYKVVGDHGELTLHNQGRKPWTPGQYVIGVRGGPNGVKTTEGDPIYASQTFYLVAQGQSLETEQNIALLRAQAGSQAKALALAQQLDQLILLYRQPFALINSRFPQQELAVMTTFAIAPATTQVDLDPNRGLVPLPIDLLRDPRPASVSCPACGKLTPLAACTLAQGGLDSAGVCRDSRGNVNAAAGGFAALDGFATTGAILAPTNNKLLARTITPATVQLYDLSVPTAPVLVPPSSYLTEPCELTSSCSDLSNALSPVIALQPAGPTSGDPTSVFRTRPLKDATDYAIVISDGVLDQSGRPLAAGTVSKILRFQNPLVDGAGASQLAGIDNATAGALELMRQQLRPVINAASANGIASSHVVMAYTFHTQTILSTAVQLGALPYTKPATTGAPAAVTALTPAAAWAKFGVSTAQVPGSDGSNIAEILETTITTFNLLDPASGAFNPTGTTANETIKVMIATPLPGATPACTGALTPFGRCSPMVIFRHGLGGGRADMLTVANNLTKAGMTVVAIDAAKHGDRSFCTAGTTTTVIGGTTVPVCANPAEACVSPLPAGAQGDANPPGTCVTSGFFKRPVSAACFTGACGAFTDGIPAVSANFLTSANFFRTRDTLRQDIIDQSQLVRAIAFAPSGAPPTGHTVFDRMVSQGRIINPAAIYYMGQSLGAIQGTVDVATNPRISKAVLNVGGGTVVDIFTNSPAFTANTNALLAGLGVQPGTPAYLQFLVVAKTILDPADPVNFASHLLANTLPNLLPPLGGAIDGSVKQAPKAILTQAAFCDQTVPNPFNFILDSTIGTGPRLIDPTFTLPGTFQLFLKGAPPASAAALQATLATCPSPTSGKPAPSATAVSHGFITDWSNAGITDKGQSDAAAFLSAGTLPLSLVVLP